MGGKDTREKKPLCFFLIAVTMISTVMTGFSIAIVSGNGTTIIVDGNLSDWEGISSAYVDEVGDTQPWSTNMTILSIGNTSEAGLPGAPFDEARDLKSFYVWLQDENRIYFRLDVAGLPGANWGYGGLNAVTYVVAMDTNFIEGSGIGDLSCACDTYPNSSVCWERLFGWSGYNIAWLQDENWNAIDSTSGTLKLAQNVTLSAFEFSIPRSDFPEEWKGNVLRITVASFKPGESWGEWGYWTHAFDPQAPGTPGETSGIPGEAAAGSDLADAIPGGIDGIEILIPGLREGRVKGYLTVGKREPTAKYTYYPQVPHENQTIVFNASASIPGWNGTAEDPILSYGWNFGDGNSTSVSSPLINHKFIVKGTYNVTLNVTDSRGLWDVTSKLIQVLPVTPYGPTAFFNYMPIAPHVNRTVTFNASGSLSGWNGTADMPIVSYAWDFGDNTTGTGVTINHTYATEGNFVVTLNVTDSQGLWNATSKKMTVTKLHFVHISSRDPHYFEFDDGTPFIPIGMNTGWWVTEQIFQQMNAHGMNLARVWMCSWHINIEKQLGVYDESECKKLDSILQLAERYDIYIQLCLLTFTDFSDIYPGNWENNPYNSANGGPIGHPVDFLTNPVSISYIKKRFNYILNRWGSNPYIAMWEFWNEISIVGLQSDGRWATDSESKAWHENVAQVFRQNDTYHRPLTTSCHGDLLWNQTYRSNAIDVIQIHTYKTSDPVYLAELVSGYIRSYLDYGKPVMIGEYGLDTLYPSSTRAEHLNNGIWSAWASGAGGASMWWYGDSMTEEMFDRYLYFERFIRDVSWPTLHIRPGTGSLSGTPDTMVYSLQGNGFALAWVLHTVSGTVSGAQLTFSDLINENYTVYVYDDSTGSYLDCYNVTVSSGNLTIYLPDFTKHLAVKITTKTPIKVRDVAIMSVMPSATEAYPTWIESLNITVTVRNWGYFSESFNVTAYYNGNLIGTKTVVNLTSFTEATIIFAWDVPEIPKAYPYPGYTISANISVVQNETYTADNTYVDGTVKVKWSGDCNGDGKVDGHDLYLMAISWHKGLGNPGYDVRADFNNDSTIDGNDLYVMAVNWHRGPLD